MGQSLVTIQNSLSAGELSPELWGRTDLEKYKNGTTTCRNFFSDYRGGVKTRAGLAYVGTCKQAGTSAPPRDIPFQFSVTQGYVLEFGDSYMRVKYQGAYITEASKNILGITQANPASINITAHGYSPGDWIYIAGVVGMTNFNTLTWIVDTALDANHVTLKDLFGNVVDSTTYSAYISGGTAARIYTVSAPYAAVDLPYLKYTQSADVMTLTCVNQETSTEYAPYDLVRNSDTNWVFTATTFAASISAPTGLTGHAQSSTDLTTWYSYVVTAVDSSTGEESVASAAVSVQNNDIALYSGTNNISWTPVTGAGSYNIYASTPSYGYEVSPASLYGYIGTSLGTNFADTNIIPDFTIVPPTHKNPFARNSITDISVTNSGVIPRYSQNTVGYTITTSTGSGFSGKPIVNVQNLSGINYGYFGGFVIYNGGQDYTNTDTISISDTGGGVASGAYTFSANPVDANDIIVNGERIEFYENTHGTAYPTYTKVESTLALTMQTLANTLNSSPLLSLNVANYYATSGGIYIDYKTPGSIGNAFTLAVGSSPCTVTGATLTGGGTLGSGATASLVLGPSSGTYPSVCAYYQQRRVYASSLNNPDTYWMSKPGEFTNFDNSIPVSASDSITGTPWAQQVNGIQFLVPMPGGLVVLTGKGAWQVNGGSSAAITPSDQTAIPQAYNGCNAIVPPITINYDILYVQAKGSIVRDLSYNFFVNIYTGTDLTILSNHLFFDKTITQWAWCEEPYKLVWVLRDDGTLLSLTYLKEQDVYAWTRHDTNGQVVSVCSVTEPPVDALYVITKRYVQGAWRYYSERMNNRVWSNVQDVFCVDSGLTSTLTYPNATLTPAAATGSSVVFTASSSVFTSANVGDVIRIDGGVATVTTYTSGTQVICDITEDLTQLIPNDPNGMPVPATSGNWSIATPITTVTGLNHLEGLDVAILADGSVVPNQTVTNNSITLSVAASNVVVGLPYTCQLQTVYLDAAGEQTIQNRRKNISAVGLRVNNTRGITIGADQVDASTQPNGTPVPWTDLIELQERTSSTPAGVAIPLYTGDYYTAVTSGWDLKGQVAIQQSYPLPADILAVISYWQIGDDK